MRLPMANDASLSMTRPGAASCLSAASPFSLRHYQSDMQSHSHDHAQLVIPLVGPLEIEVQGAMQVHEKRPDAVMVFIAPPSFEELANRLRGRGTEDEAKVQKRLETAKGELAQQDKFDYVVVNDTVERAVEELHGILAKRR